mmetsp:Transcript_23647/g.33190  ORF Transcript_23647/g.33190 Transcript_23647/m.33190 type:complete len:165 (+) Transcript_23647:2250-2744(+)
MKRLLPCAEHLNTWHRKLLRPKVTTSRWIVGLLQLLCLKCSLVRLRSFQSKKMKLFKKILVVNFKPEHIENEDARDLVTKILVHKPTSRLGNQADGVCDILDHPFFNSINWKKLKNKEMEPPWKPEPKEAVDLPEGSFLKEDCNGETESSEVDDELFEDFSEHG